MAESTRNPAVWTLVLGPGPRLAAFEPTARARLGALNADVAAAVTRIDDLAELLRQGARGGGSCSTPTNCRPRTWASYGASSKHGPAGRWT